MRNIPLLVLTLGSLAPVHLAALEVRFHPADTVYSYEVDPVRGLSTGRTRSPRAACRWSSGT